MLGREELITVEKALELLFRYAPFKRPREINLCHRKRLRDGSVERYHFTGGPPFFQQINSGRICRECC